MGGLEEGAKSREGSSRRQWKTSLPPNGLAGRAWAARAPRLPRAAWGPLTFRMRTVTKAMEKMTIILMNWL